MQFLSDYLFSMISVLCKRTIERGDRASKSKENEKLFLKPQSVCTIHKTENQQTSDEKFLILTILTTQHAARLNKIASQLLSKD